MEVLDDGRRRDLATGEMLPWYTHGAQDEIRGWDLAGKVVLEWGGGDSTLWWARRCRQVFTIEDDPEWCSWIASHAVSQGIGNLTVLHRAARQMPAERFTALPEGCVPDIVVIDGAMRFACLAKALTLPRPLTIIYDNWCQREVLPWRAAETMMRPYLGVSYAQPEILVGYGPWQTAIWHLTAEPSHRLANIARTALPQPTLSESWDNAAIERRFRTTSPGLAVIDEFLNDAALASLSITLPESSFCHSLLDQMAAELAHRLPGIIGLARPLRAISLHQSHPGLRRDFAAITLALFIAPAEPASAEITFHNVRLPPGKDARLHESRKEETDPVHTSFRRANAVTVRCRRNRAVIFNSGLFYETTQHPAAFTGLGGIHLHFGHRDAALPKAAPISNGKWRSAAFRGTA